MPKLDSSIYGIDDNAMANGISSDALQPGGVADTHGPITQDKANAKGNTPDPAPVVTKGKDNADGRARTKGNHGAQD